MARRVIHQIFGSHCLFEILFVPFRKFAKIIILKTCNNLDDKIIVLM